MGYFIFGGVCYTILVAAAYFVATKDQTKISSVEKRQNQISNWCTELKNTCVAKSSFENVVANLVNTNKRQSDLTQREIETLKKKIEYLEMVLTAKSKTIVHKIEVKRSRSANLKRPNARAGSGYAKNN